MKKLITSFILLTTFFNAAFSETKADIIDRFLSIFHEVGFFSGCALISENNEIIFDKAFGYSDNEKKEILNLNSAFYLASVSKPFTSTAIMILKEERKLSFDDKLSKFFPDFPIWADEITIEHLLTHTSGIPDYFGLGLRKPDLTNQDVIDLLKSVEHLDFDPNTEYKYSNSGYVLLSVIVEKVANEPFHEFLKERIFAPFGMSHTLVFDKSKPDVPNRAIGYDMEGNLADYDILTTGDGGIFSTVQDLYKFERALSSGEIISQGNLKRAFTPHVLDGGKATHYGYGWTIANRGTDNRVQHSGGFDGFQTHLEHDFQSNSVIILLSNNGSPYVSRVISHGIRNILQNKALERNYEPLRDS